MKPHPAAVALVLCAVAPLSGCCTLARLFCGPDTSPWVPISCETPRATLQTFLEAVRRDSPAQVYQCLARSYLERHDLDKLVLTAFWQELRRQQPHLHMLGYAEVPERPTITQDGGVTYELLAHGTKLRLHLVRQSYWEVHYRSRDGEQHEAGQTLDFDTLNGLLRVVPLAEPDPIDGMPQSRIEVEPRTVVHGIGGLQLDDLDRVEVGREWKIADLVVVE